MCVQRNLHFLCILFFFFSQEKKGESSSTAGNGDVMVDEGGGGFRCPRCRFPVCDEKCKLMTIKVVKVHLKQMHCDYLCRQNSRR